jgi:acyl-CoA synthetase (AMP-forming)/AMP-acid ligase II
LTHLSCPRCTRRPPIDTAVEAELFRLDGHSTTAALPATAAPVDELTGGAGYHRGPRRVIQQLEEAAFIAWCRNGMANHEVPRAVVQVEALPLNTGLKADKLQLRERATVLRPATQTGWLTAPPWAAGSGPLAGA